MKNIQNVIEKLGYKKKEAEFYLAALFLGESKISDLAQKLKIPRTSALMIAEKLQNDGLLNYYVKRFNKYWVAERPDNLLLKLNEMESMLKAVLPELNAIRLKTAIGKPTVKVYVGAKEIELIFADILLTRNNFRAIVSWTDFVRILGDAYVTGFIRSQMGNFIKMQLLTHESYITTVLRGRDLKESRETRFLSGAALKLNTAIFMYGNKIAIISLNETLSTGFLIEDIDVETTMSVLFEELWSRQLV